MDTQSVDASPLVADETLLPGQFAELQRSTVRSGEHRLLYAVLEDAVRCWQVHDGATSQRGSRLFQDTAAWFASDSDASPFTFVAICQVFDLEPDVVRAGLRSWSARRRETRGKVVPFRLRRMNGTRHTVTATRPGSGRIRAHG